MPANNKFYYNLLLAGRVLDNNLLLARRVPDNNLLLAGRVPDNNLLLAGRVPYNNLLLAERVPDNNLLLAGRVPDNNFILKILQSIRLHYIARYSCRAALCPGLTVQQHISLSKVDNNENS